MMTNRFKLFSNCVPVKGAKRSIICDLQRGNYEFIPNSLYEILSASDSFKIEELIKIYGHEDQETMIEYLEFLEQKEYGFWTDKPDHFPEINFEWRHYSSITHAIIDSDENSNHNFKKIAEDLEDINCEHIELRFYDFISDENLIKRLSYFDESMISSIELLIPFQVNFSKENFRLLFRRFPRIERIIVHSSPENKSFTDAKKHPILNALYYTKQVIESETHCGVVHPVYFVINIQSFSESKNHNSCLNGKIAIDKHGFIRNCPSLPEQYGHIEKISLKEVVLNKKVKELWTITKDVIDVCKDCEFRYISSDCRAYTSPAKDGYHGKPLKCTYDPYEARWENTKPSR